jgi:transglutaminase-like putative cysteine protease
LIKTFCGIGALVGIWLLHPTCALAQPSKPSKGEQDRGYDQVRYDQKPAWVAPAPSATEIASPAGAPYRILYHDSQIHFAKDFAENNTSFRVRILAPQALAIGSLSLAWNPASQSVTVNSLKIHRGTEEIDVLKTSKFKVIQREANLEVSMLTGILTATLQVPGLEVGDELELSTTLRDRDTVFGGRIFGGVVMSLAEGPGANRIQLSWVGGREPKFQSSRDLPKVVTSSDGTMATWEMRDPPKLTPVDGAPARYNLWRFVEFSDFGNWENVSRTLYPLFEAGATLRQASPLQAEITRIAAQSTDPLERAGAALKLVQDQVRYVYVGLNGGNYRPVAADETWKNRFGDCKAKSVLLMALLRGLGISAEVVAVHSSGGDGLGERLQGPHVFDHVIVRATIAGKPYYLDGTQYGDRVLSLLEEPKNRYILPLTSAGSALEALALQPSHRPNLVRTIDMDASAGFDEPAKITQTNFIMGEDAGTFRSQLAALSPEQVDRALRSYWQGQEGWIEADEVTWHYDDAKSTTVLTIKGKVHPEWEGDAVSGRSITTPRGGFYPPNELKRPAGQDQTIPYVTDFPSYVCSITNVKLPKSSAPRLVWDYLAGKIDEQIGGVHYYRRTQLTEGVLRSIRISKTYLPELAASQAQAIKKAIPAFNNKMVQVYERQAVASDRGAVDTAFPVALVGAIDWTATKTPCTISEK